MLTQMIIKRRWWKAYDEKIENNEETCRRWHAREEKKFTKEN